MRIQVRKSYKFQKEKGERFWVKDSLSGIMWYWFGIINNMNDDAGDEYKQKQINELEASASQEQLPTIQDEIEQIDQTQTVENEQQQQQEQFRRDDLEQDQLNEHRGITIPQDIEIVENEIEQMDQINMTHAIHQKEEEEHQ
ncbi:hypothetical protein I4U23_010822 [Adineta vaga]|nr:hypothetical protein I4U23_010822 [Adineta vaga]